MGLRVAGRVLTLIVFVTNVSAACFAQTENPSHAIDRALRFIYTTASDKTVFADHGEDFLWCFFSIGLTAQDPELRQQAAKMGIELAANWRLSHPHVSKSAHAGEIKRLVMEAYAADRLGVRDRRFKEELRRAAARFTARDFLGFDAPNEPPDPNDANRYDTWCGALICTFFGDGYGIELGARHRDVVKWLPRLHPYREGDESLQFDEFYAITHLIYTLNAYGEHRVSPSSLLEEIGFLKRRMSEALDDDDPEMVGEGMDCLKMLGFENDPLVLRGKQYLLSTQRPDGTWAGDPDDIFTAYHSAWTSIDGLRDYRFRGKVRKLSLK